MGLVYNPIHNRKDNMKLELNDTFTIGYFAKKHNKRIYRKCKWTDKCRYWTSKVGDSLITFLHAGEHQTLGILISFAGVMSMFGGLPDNA